MTETREPIGQKERADLGELGIFGVPKESEECVGGRERALFRALEIA